MSSLNKLRFYTFQVKPAGVPDVVQVSKFEV